MLRGLKIADLNKLREIHEKHYKDAFPFPDLTKFISFISSIDSSGEIVAVGGVRSIAEVVTITDKDKSPIVRYRALKAILEHSKRVADRHGYYQLYSHVSNADGPNWTEAQKAGGAWQLDAVPLIYELKD